jgi:hypothetical protein
MIKKLVLIFLSIWLGTTCLVDFVVVPTVFQVIENFFNAGELGVALFTKMNVLELILSLTLVCLISIEYRKYNRRVVHVFFAISAAIIVVIYFSYLTPKIAELTLLWKKADSQGLVAIAGIKDIQQEHQFYHRTYVTLDSIKILILATLLIFRLREKALEHANT